MNTNVEALQRLYVKMGGNPEDVSDKTTISEMIDAITAIGIVDRVARSGNYITATTSAEMNDESAIYVYTGSETGYNQGHLYYWDGTAFVDGGEYNGAKAEIDPTLSHTGKAADAKETGDAINALNGSLGAKADISSLGLIGIKSSEITDLIYATNGSGTPVNDNGSYSISGQTENTAMVVLYKQRTAISYSIVPYWYGSYSPGKLTMLFPFYQIGNDLYCIRFSNATTMEIQRYNISTQSGGSVKTMTVSRWFESGEKVTVKTSIDNKVSVYAGSELLGTLDFARIVSSSGVHVAGYVCTSLTKWTSTNNKVIFSALTAIDLEYDFGSISEQTALAVKDVKALNAKTNRAYHFSFDDVISVFEDLTTNAGTYTSIFDNAFLSDLKGLHDTFGCCFSLYCFFRNGSAGSTSTFTLEDCTDAFASEFAANSDWLRFSMHAYGAGYRYNAGSTAEADAGTHYDATITQLVRITGSVDCIDRIPRLHEFAGSKTACEAIRDANCGAIGFLAAMKTNATTERDSYYFTPEQNAYMAKHYRYYDPETDLIFIKTSYGINSISTANAYVTDRANANMRGFVEMFLHENQWSSSMKTMWTNIANALTQQGYTSGFYMDRMI